MKFVWAALFLLAVVVGSLVVWQGFGLNDRGPFKRGGSVSPEAAKPEGTVLAEFGPAPEFALTERNGRSFAKAELHGSPWIADFIFTSCAGQCPLMSLQMQGLQKKLGPETGFRFVSFTVDPERDTPEKLSEYADRYLAEKDRWFFLTGPKPEINRILKQFFLSEVEEPAMHSIRFILVDGEGKIRGYYDSSIPDSMNQLIHDAQIVIAPKRGYPDP